MQLLEVSRTADSPGQFLRKSGEIFSEWNERTQDSGNVSYGIRTDHGRFFVKTAGSPEYSGALPFEDRVSWLRNAIRLNRVLQDPALCPLRNVVESPGGPLLVYDWADGELIRTAPAQRTDPAAPFSRFTALPLLELTSALSAIFRVHAALCANGWVACDFYDGSMLYDFDAHRLTLVDLDMYREGSFVNNVGRMFGSTRFMAPEEFERGSVIDESTTVFTMGKCIKVFLTVAVDTKACNALPELLAVAGRACQTERTDRWPSMVAFFAAWLLALAKGGLTQA